MSRHLIDLRGGGALGLGPLLGRARLRQGALQPRPVGLRGLGGPTRPVLRRVGEDADAVQVRQSRLQPAEQLTGAPRVPGRQLQPLEHMEVGAPLRGVVLPGELVGPAAGVEGRGESQQRVGMGADLLVERREVRGHGRRLAAPVQAHEPQQVAGA